MAGEDPNDVIDAHEDGREKKNGTVNKSAAEGRGEHGEHKRENGTADEDGHGQGEGRTDAAEKDVFDGFIHFERVAQIAADKRGDEVDELAVSGPDEGFIVAPFMIEGGDGFGRGIFAEDGLRGRTAEDVEEKERQQQYAQRRRYHLGNAFRGVF